MRFLVTLVFVLSLFFFRGQTVNSYRGEITSRAVGVGNSAFYLERFFDYCCRFANSVAKTRNGHVFDRHSLGSVTGYSNTSLIESTADKHIVVVSGTNTGVCDNYGSPAIFLVKLDTSLIVKWKKSSKKNITHLIGLADSSIIYVAVDKLYRLNSNGIHTDSLMTGFGKVSSICRYNNDTFLVNHKQGAVSTLTKVDNHLKVGGSTQIISTADYMQVLADTSLVVLSGGRLFRYNKSLQQPDSSDNLTSAESYAIRGFTAAGDTIYCIGAGTGNNWTDLQYSMFDKSLTQLHQVKANFRNADPKSIALTGNKVNLLANCPPYNVYNSWIDLINIDKKGTITSVGDIGVISSSIVATSYGGPMPVSNIASTVTVKNFGTFPIQSFNVNYLGPGVPWCHASGTIKNVNHYLLPGDSVTVDLPIFNTLLPGTTIGSAAQLCFYTTLPNATHDTEGTNDSFCATTTIVGLKEETETVQINIFPNPSRDRIKIESEVPVKSIEIRDVCGRSLRTLDGENRMSFTAAHNLPPGLYILQIETGSRKISRKVMVE